MSMSNVRETSLPEREHAGTPQSPALDAAAAVPVVTLIPDSSIQFLDLRLSDEAAANVRRRYFEDYGDGSSEAAALHAVTLEDGIFHHPVTQLVGNAAETYVVDGTAAITPFLDAWLPIPFLRVVDDADAAGAALDAGPTNWARLHISRDASAEEGGYAVVLALDTTLDTRANARVTDAAPTPQDAIADTLFQFSSDENDVGGFVTEAWVDDWLAEVYQEHHKRRIKHGEDEWVQGRPLEHLAHYLTLLAVLDEAGVLPDVRFQDTLSAAGRNVIAVDLVLDIGNSRTLALISEAGSSPALTHEGAISPLPIRNLTRPAEISRGVVSSRIEFAKPDFGKEALSRWSGRANAFNWPSLARLGDEAAALACCQDANGDQTGLSSPMRYLWDEKATEKVWRFASPQPARTRRSPLISGPQLALVSETGSVLGHGERGGATTKPRFSRSSLTTFLGAELLTHAICAINSPDHRQGRDRAEIPRRLDRIVVTVPASLHTVERDILRRRLDNAIDLVWHGLGWSANTSAPRRPAITIVNDNAANAEIAYLYNEITQKFRGKARDYLDLLGKVRPEQRTGKSLRIAALDIGGGSTSLSVATCALGETGQIVRSPQLSDGMALGGDDIVKAIVERHLIPAMADHLAACGLHKAQDFLAQITGAAASSRKPWLADFAGRLASDLLAPAAIALLHEHNASPSLPDDVPCERTFRALLAAAGTESEAVSRVLDELASDEGAEGFSPLDTPVTFLHRDLAETIRLVLEPVLANAIRIVQALDCDLVLLSGWAARLPVALDTLLQRMPTRPNRIVPMHQYRIGEWYPLRDASGKLGDTKSLAAVGALIASLSGRPGSFAISLRPLEADALRLFVGPIGANGLIAADTVLFTIEPANFGRDIGDSRSATAVLDLPAVIGMRRLPLESWPATPLYRLALGTAAAARVKGPLKITFERVQNGHGAPDGLKVVRANDGAGNTVLPAELALSLQTLPSSKGHWLDTGAISVAAGETSE